MWSSSSSSAATANSSDTHTDTPKRQPGDNVGMDSNPVCSSGGFRLEGIYPTPVNDREKASFVSAEFATCIGKKDNLERPVVRVRPYVPDIANAPAAGRMEMSALDESTESTMPKLSGSVSKLKHMFESMSYPKKYISVSSLSLDKSEDLPTLKVKEIVAKFGIPDYGNSSKPSDDATGKFDNRHKDEHRVVDNIDVMVCKQDEDISEFLKWNPSVDYDALPEISTTPETVMERKELWAPGKQTEIKPIIPTSGVSVLTKTLSSDRMARNAEQCDDLRDDREFLYENDRITLDSLRKNSEPELIRRETLTTQFLFGWGKENEGREKDMKDDDLESVQTNVETYSETSEITLNNDIICKSVDTKEIKDRKIEDQENNTVQTNLAKEPIPTPKKSVLPESSKNYFGASGSEDTCRKTPEEIFISVNFETEQGLESDYHIPLKKSNKLEPDVIPLQSDEQQTYLAKENGQRNEETGNYFSSNGAPASGVNNPDGFVNAPQETLIAPVMVSPASKYPSAGPSKEHPPIVYKSLSDAVCDILGDVKNEANAPYVLYKETRKANCDNIQMKQSNLEQAVIDSSSVVAADNLESRADTSVSAACNLPDVVQSGSNVGHDNGYQSFEPQIMEYSADKHISRDINLADARDPVFIVSMKHLNVADNPSEIDKPEDSHQSELKSESDVDSDDSDTVGETEEMATQKSLMEMYQTLLTGSASHDSSHDDESESKSEDIDNSSSGTESDADEEDGGVFSGTAMPEDPVTMRQKRASLTHTLMENLGSLTSDGFHNLMASYRDPSSPVNKFGETVILDATLKSQLDDWQSRQFSVDEQSEPDLSLRSSDADTNQMSSSDLSVTYTVNNSSSINNDTFTQTRAIFMDISNIDKVFMETALQTGPLVSGDGVKELLQRHLAEVDVLSKIRASEKDRLEQKLKDKLAQKERQRQKMSVSDEEELQMEELQLAVVNKLDRKLSADLEELNQQCIKKVDILQEGELNPEMIQTLMTEHRTQQAELIAQRLEERQKQNQLLTKRLEQGQRLLLATNEKEAGSTPTSVASLPSNTDTVDIEKKVSAMDDKFYKDLVDRRSRESIGEEELENLVEEHLEKVEQFRNKLQEMLKRKRKERREKMKRKRKKTKEFQGKEELSVTGLIREQGEVDRQVQDIRQQHREKSDFKLQQILQSKQKKKESTNLSETIKSSPVK